MAVIHLKGSAGNNALDGLTWANAQATAASASSAAGAGGTVWADASATETSSASQPISGGTRDDPLMLVSGTPDVSTGLTAVSKGYALTVSGGSFNITVSGHVYVEGLVLTAGTLTQNGQIQLATATENTQRWKNCDLILGGSSTTARISCGLSTNDNARVDWSGVNVRFAHTLQGIAVVNAELRWVGGGIISGSSAVVTLLTTAGASARGSLATLTGVDLSAMSSSGSILSSPQGTTRVALRGCTMPTGWYASGQPIASVGTSNARVEMYDCAEASGSGSPFWIQDQFGSARQELTTTRTGQGDARADYSIKIDTTANPQWPWQGFRMHEQAIYNSTTGVSKTLTVEVTSATLLKTRDLVLRARYYASSGSTLYTQVTSEPTVISADANITTSSVTWNSAQTNKQKLSVTFTPQKAGYILWDLVAYGASQTIYVAPKPTIA